MDNRISKMIQEAKDKRYVVNSQRNIKDKDILDITDLDFFFQHNRQPVFFENQNALYKRKDQTRWYRYNIDIFCDDTQIDSARVRQLECRIERQEKNHNELLMHLQNISLELSKNREWIKLLQDKIEIKYKIIHEEIENCTSKKVPQKKNEMQPTKSDKPNQEKSAKE